MATSIHGGTAPLASLTTIFTPPCPTSWLVVTTKAPSQYPSFPTDGPSSCDPPSWTSNIADEGFQYYSPAICPDGFSVGPGCSITGRTRTAEGFPAIEPGETVAWCVPSGLSCTSDTTDFRGGVWGVSAGPSTFGSAAFTIGPAMQIRWRDVDLTALETHPLSPGVVVGSGDRTTAGANPTQPLGTTAPGVTFSTIVPPYRTISGRPTQILPTTASIPSKALSSANPSNNNTATTSSSSSSSSSSPASSGAAAEAGISPMRWTMMAVVITLATLVVLFIAGISIFLFIRRYRRRHAGRLDGLLPVGLGVWVNRYGNRPPDPPPYRSGASSGLGPMTEVDEQLGTTTTATAVSRIVEPPTTQRLSWPAGVPKIFSPWSWKTIFGPGSSRLSGQTSRWTESEKALSPDRETFSRGQYPSALGMPGSDREFWSPGATLGYNEASPLPWPDPVRLNRLSDGTFGRQRSPVPRRSEASS